MYIVTIKNGQTIDQIQNYHQKLASGKVTKGINSIDSFAFSLLPNNIGFNRLFDFKTLVDVYNTNKKRYEFQGRVLYTSSEMGDSGLIKKDVTCESFFGYLCDSQQLYVEERNWTVKGLLAHVINTHNSQVEAEKRFTIRTVTVEDPNDNLYVGIQRDNTWKTIQDKLIGVLGGEVRFEVVNGVIYLDYLKEIGINSATEIALSKNMKSIVQEKDPTAYITRLIPLGAKISDDSEERLTVESVNNGSIYIDDTEAIEYFGVHVGYKEFDDVTEASNLLAKAHSWLENNNKVQVKYSITALDLSLIGKNIDDFEVHNYHPVKNALLGINDKIRVIKKVIDICEETKTTIEAGENFKTLTELQAQREKELGEAVKVIEEIKKNYVTNQKLQDERYFSSLIDQWADKIALSVSGKYVTQGIFKDVEGKLELKLDEKDLVSVLNATADIITFGSSTLDITTDRLSITGDNFSVKNGLLTAKGATIEGALTATSLTIKEGATITGDITANSLLHTGQNGSTTQTLRTYDGGIDVRLQNSGKTAYVEIFPQFMTFYDDGTLGNAQARFSWGLNNEFYVNMKTGTGYFGGTWKTEKSIQVDSDRTLKHDIEKLSDKYSVLFDKLNSVRFKYNKDPSTYHAGFIAQEVEQALFDAGLSTSDFGVSVSDRGTYSLNYDDFIALCVNEIQKLKKELKTVKEKVYG